MDTQNNDSSVVFNLPDNLPACPDLPAHLTLVKSVITNNGGTAVATDWTLSASGPTPISGPGGVSSDVNPGTYTLSESSGPSGYSASHWACNAGTGLDGTHVTLTGGQNATCTITNDDIPAVTVGGPIVLTNAASFAIAISPGSLVTLFGNGNVLATTTVSGFRLPLPTSANGTSVTIDGVLCPLLYVSPSQMNFQAPMGLRPGMATATVNNNGRSFSTTVQVLSAASGIFTSDYYANGGLAILQDSRTGALLDASNPAVAGGNVTMYFTGIGPITNNPGTGGVALGSPSLSQSTSTVGLTVNGISVQPSFTGLAPGFAGLGQLNFQYPSALRQETPFRWC